MSSTNTEENQIIDDPESSDEEVTGFKFLGKIFFGTVDVIALKDQFRVDVETIVTYLQALKAMTDSIQSMCISGKSYHIDASSEVQISGWRYMAHYLRKVAFVKSNQSEADSLLKLCDRIGFAEERQFYDIYHVEHDSNIYYSATKHRTEIDQHNKSAATLVKICLRRRRKVVKSLIIQDLQAQGIKYQKAMIQLDHECRMLSNIQNFVKENRSFHIQHFKQSLAIIHQLAITRSDIINEETKKRQRERAKSRKSVKGRDRTLKK